MSCSHPGAHILSSSLSLSPKWEHSQKVTVCEPRWPFQKPDHAGTMISDFPASRTIQNKCYLSHPVYSILLEQPELNHHRASGFFPPAGRIACPHRLRGSWQPLLIAWAQWGKYICFKFALQKKNKRDNPSTDIQTQFERPTRACLIVSWGVGRTFIFLTTLGLLHSLFL